MTSVRIDPSFIAFTSSDIPEGSNLYYSDTRVRLNRLDQMASPTSDVNMGGFKLTNQATPSGPNDSATKAYVDSVAQGLSPKSSVKATTTSALPAILYNNGASGVGATLTAVSVGILTIDGTTLLLGDRVLIKDQVSSLQNGIYTVTTLGTALVAFVLTRAIDNDTSDKILGSFVFTEMGVSNSDSGFVNTNTSLITIGTTGITWTQFSGAGQIIAGNGLTKTGNQIDVVTANSGRIVINADSIDLASGIVATGTYTKITLDTYGRATAGASATTSDISEGTNLYYTTARANSDFDTRLATKSTTNLSEGTNLYYTDTRARAAISASSPLGYSAGVVSLTGIIPIANGGTAASDIVTARTNLDTRRNRASLVVVKALSDLPSPVMGVITLADNTEYEINGLIDCGTNTITFGTNSRVFGIGRTVDILKYTGTGTFLTIGHACLVSDVGFQCASGTLLSVSGASTDRVRFHRCFFDSIKTLGSLTTCALFELLVCNITNITTGGFTVSGTGVGIFELVDCYLDNNAGTFLSLGTSTISGLKALANTVKINSGQTFLSNTSVTITFSSVEGNSFINSGGTILSGLTVNDTNWFFFNNFSIDNTQYVGEVYMQGNATGTLVGTTGTFLKALGTTSVGQNHNFTGSTNRLTYSGNFTGTFLVHASMSIQTNGGAPETLSAAIFKNGVKVSSTEFDVNAQTNNLPVTLISKGLIVLTANDYIEVWITDKSSIRTLTVTQLNFTAIRC